MSTQEELFRLLLNSSNFFQFEIPNDPKLGTDLTIKIDSIKEETEFKDRFLNIMALLIASKKELKIVGYMEKKHYQIALEVLKEEPKLKKSTSLIHSGTINDIVVSSGPSIEAIKPTLIDASPSHVGTTTIKRKRENDTTKPPDSLSKPKYISVIDLIKEEDKITDYFGASMTPEEIVNYWRIAALFDLKCEIKRATNYLELIGEKEEDLAQCFVIGSSDNKSTGLWYHTQAREDVVRYIHPDGKNLAIQKSSVIAIIHGEHVGTAKEVEKKCKLGCDYFSITLDEKTDRIICIQSELTSTDMGSKDYPFFISFNTFCVAEVKHEYKTLEICRTKPTKRIRVDKKNAVPNVVAMERDGFVFLITVQTIQPGDVLFFAGKNETGFEKRDAPYKPVRLGVAKK